MGIKNGLNSKFTPEKRRFIEDNISGHRYAELVCMFNQKFNCSINLIQIKNFLHKNNLKNGRNDLPIRREIINEGHIVMKIASGLWRKKNLVIWEAANGPLPKNHVVIFADSNRLNMDLDNLLLISRQELAVMNRFGLISTNPKLTKIGLLAAKLKMLIRKHELETKEKELNSGALPPGVEV
jgi:hypothetical protein